MIFCYLKKYTFVFPFKNVKLIIQNILANFKLRPKRSPVNSGLHLICTEASAVNNDI